MTDAAKTTASKEYLRLLLQYYEEEISGIAYFTALSKYLGKENLFILLAEIEVLAGETIEPLLLKYSLNPRPKAVLEDIGKLHAKDHINLKWGGFIDHIINHYPKYLDEFDELSAMAPIEDKATLNMLTQHEIATIDFARMEKSSMPNSTEPLRRYINDALHFLAQ